MKTVGGMRRPMRRGTERVGWASTFVAAAYNLVRLPKLNVLFTYVRPSIWLRWSASRPCTKANLALARELLVAATPATPPPVEREEPAPAPYPRPCCGGRLVIIELFARVAQPRAPPTSSAFARECTT